MHLLRRYDTLDEADASSWAAAWDRQIGTNAHRLGPWPVASMIGCVDCDDQGPVRYS
jgi:hypothetical protein